MKPEDQLRPDELDVARELHENARALDTFIPPAPPFERLERTQAGVRLAQVGSRSSVRGLPVGVAAVFILFAVVIAAGLFGPRILSTAASQSPFESMSAVPSMLPSAVPTPSPSGTPLTEPTATLPPGVIYHGPAGIAAWSPDSSEIALLVRDTSGQLSVLVIGTDGRQIDRIDAVDFAWTSSDSYVALAGSGGSLEGPYQAFAGRIGSAARQPIEGSYDRGLIGNNEGAVAMSLVETGSDHYRIWGQDGLSEPRDGVPIAFSPDGSMLAVIHYPTACCAGGNPNATTPPASPTLDVVRVDTGKSLATNANVEWAYSAYLAFSPDNRHIAFLMYPKSGGTQERVGLLEIATGKFWVVEAPKDAANSFETPIWADSGHLILNGPASPLPSGMPVSVDFGPQDGTQMFASLDGQVATIAPSASQLVVTRDGASRTFDLPDTGDEAVWAPDGSKIAVLCGNSGTYPYNEDLTIIQPSILQSPTPTATPTPKPSWTPSPEPTATLPPGVIFRSTAGVMADWSPDPSEIAVTVVEEGGTPYVLVLTTGGRQIDRIDAAAFFAWTGSDTYVALDGSNGDQAFAGQIGSTVRHSISGSYETIVGGKGVVALTLKETGSDHYRIWSPAGLSEPRDGVPVAFSPDGSMLAVVHYPTSCCAGPDPNATTPPAPPTLDVVRVDTGKSLATNADVEWGGSAYLAFSPDSRYIAFKMNAQSAQEGIRLGILEIATKKLWAIAEPSGEYEWATPIWADSSHLILQGPQPPIPAGLPVSVTFENFDTGIFASLDGQVATIASGASQLVVTRGGASQTFELPDIGDDAVWAPDGSKIAVWCGGTKGPYPYVSELTIIQP